MKVVITGSAGRLAQVLIPQLAASPETEQIIGIDRRSRTYPTPVFRGVKSDVRSDELAGLMRGAEAAVHLAFVLMGGGLGYRRHQRTRVRDINLGGTRNVARAAVRAGVRRLIFVSSVAAYGAWPDNPPLIGEDQPLRPNPGFGYAEDKAAAEHWLQDFARAHPDLEILRLRLHAVIGPGSQPLLRFLLRQPFYPATGQPRPLTQCVCEQDAAAAIACALQRGTPAAYNIATQPPLSFYDMVGLSNRLRIPFPVGIADRLHRLAWRLTPAVGEPGWIAGLRYSLAVDTTRARHELGWTPRLDTHACIAECAG